MVYADLEKAVDRVMKEDGLTQSDSFNLKII